MLVLILFFFGLIESDYYSRDSRGGRGGYDQGGRGHTGGGPGYSNDPYRDAHYQQPHQATTGYPTHPYGTTGQAYPMYSQTQAATGAAAPYAQYAQYPSHGQQTSYYGHGTQPTTAQSYSYQFASQQTTPATSATATPTNTGATGANGAATQAANAAQGAYAYNYQTTGAGATGGYGPARGSAAVGASHDSRYAPYS